MLNFLKIIRLKILLQTLMLKQVRRLLFLNMMLMLTSLDVYFLHPNIYYYQSIKRKQMIKWVFYVWMTHLNISPAIFQ